MNDNTKPTDVELGLCVETVFREMPLQERMKRVADLGFGNVEFWLVDQAVSDPEALARWAERAGVRITNLVIDGPECAMSGGLTDPGSRSQWLARVATVMDYARQAGIGGAIVCTGNVVEGLSEEEMRRSVLDGLKATADLAEKADVTLLLEALNTTCDHPGYWLTSSDVGAGLCREVNSPRLRLLYDCYHMQIMEGDLIATIRKNIQYIGHFHTAGVPGRHELDENQEIYYPAVMRAIVETGFDGYVAHEYTPTRDPVQSLVQAVKACDV